MSSWGELPPPKKLSQGNFPLPPPALLIWVFCRIKRKLLNKITF